LHPDSYHLVGKLLAQLCRKKSNCVGLISAYVYTTKGLDFAGRKKAAPFKDKFSRKMFVGIVHTG